MKNDGVQEVLDAEKNGKEQEQKQRYISQRYFVPKQMLPFLLI
jgi:hypothetical protein